MDTKSLFSDRLFQGLYSKINEHFKDKIQLRNIRKDKNLTLGGATLFSIGLEKQGIENAVIGINPHGKPYILGGNVFFNISHSGDISVCAFGDSEIGVDIEEKKRPIPKRVKEKYRIDDIKEWTRKEAFSKCVGTGYVTEIFMTDLSDERIVFSGKKYFLKSFDLGDYFLSVCTENCLPPDTITEFKGEEI